MNYQQMTIGYFQDGSPIKSEISIERWEVMGSDLNDPEYRNGWSTGHQSPSLYLRAENGEVSYFSMAAGAFMGRKPPEGIPHEWICSPDIIGQWVRVAPDYDDLKIAWESDLKRYA
jgi:hypothetical protein